MKLLYFGDFNTFLAKLIWFYGTTKLNPKKLQKDIFSREIVYFGVFANNLERSEVSSNHN